MKPETKQTIKEILAIVSCAVLLYGAYCVGYIQAYLKYHDNEIVCDDISLFTVTEKNMKYVKQTCDAVFFAYGVSDLVEEEIKNGRDQE